MDADDPGMDYVVWKTYLPGSGYAMAEETTGLDADEERHLRYGGHRLDPPPSGVRVVRLSEGLLGDVLGTAWMGRFASSMLLGILRSFGANVQAVPALVDGSGPPIRIDLLNVLDVVDCVDPAASDLEVIHGERDVVSAVRRLALRDLPRRAGHVVQAAGIADLVLVSADLRSALESGCAAPGLFVEPSDFRRG
jgi:hypothetical protein